MHETLGVAHHERTELQPEQVAVGERQVVDARDPHRAGLGVQPGRERAERVHAATDPVLGLEDDRIVALAGQLEGGDEAGHPGADDDDPLGRSRPRLEALGRRRERLRSDRLGRRLGLGRRKLRRELLGIRGGVSLGHVAVILPL